MRRRHPLASQVRGMSLISTLLIMGLVGFVIVIAFQAVPVVVEANSVKTLVKSSLKEAPDHARIRQAFASGVAAGYISDITANDLQIVTKNGITSVHYNLDKSIHLFGPASLTLNYDETISTAD
jgi:hypothetical protein